MLDQETLIRDVVRLRRAERRIEDDDVAAVGADLETALGPTVRRAVAARALGVSQTALDRWIGAGDVPVVVTTNGRTEVPSDALADLVERVEERRAAGALRPLADELNARRRRAAALDAASIVPHDRGLERPHRLAELRALAYHRALATRLDDRLVADARRRLRRWREDGRIHPRYAAAWERLLAGEPAEIAEAIRADDAASADLRQSSPFAGALDEATRRRVMDAVAALAA